MQAEPVFVLTCSSSSSTCLYAASVPPLLFLRLLNLTHLLSDNESWCLSTRFRLSMSRRRSASLVSLTLSPRSSNTGCLPDFPCLQFSRETSRKSSRMTRAAKSHSRLKATPIADKRGYGLGARDFMSTGFCSHCSGNPANATSWPTPASPSPVAYRLSLFHRSVCFCLHLTKVACIDQNICSV